MGRSAHVRSCPASYTPRLYSKIEEDGISSFGRKGGEPVSATGSCGKKSAVCYLPVVGPRAPSNGCKQRTQAMEAIGGERTRYRLFAYGACTMTVTWGSDVLSTLTHFFTRTAA